MPGKPLTRQSFLRAHFGITATALFVAQTLSNEVVGMIAFITAAVMTFPVNIILLLVANLLEGLLDDYAFGQPHIFIIVSLALSTLLLNSWLWAFILFRNSPVPVREASASPPEADQS